MDQKSVAEPAPQSGDYPKEWLAGVQDEAPNTVWLGCWTQPKQLYRKCGGAGFAGLHQFNVRPSFEFDPVSSPFREQPAMPSRPLFSRR